MLSQNVASDSLFLVNGRHLHFWDRHAQIQKDTFVLFCNSKFHGKADLWANICLKIGLAVETWSCKKHEGVRLNFVKALPTGWALFCWEDYNIETDKISIQTYIQTYKRTDRQTDRQTDRHTDIPTDRQTDIHTDRQTAMETDRQTDMEADRQTDKEVLPWPKNWKIETTVRTWHRRVICRACTLRTSAGEQAPTVAGQWNTKIMSSKVNVYWKRAHSDSKRLESLNLLQCAEGKWALTL